jgi:hypothetical protein
MNAASAGWIRRWLDLDAQAVTSGGAEAVSIPSA